MSGDPLRYEPGDLLVDHEQDRDERGTVVALRYLRDDGDVLRANECRPSGLDGKTVATVNEDEYATDPVVQVMFEAWLDSNVVGWLELLDDATETDESFGTRVMRYCHDWGIPQQAYAYPQGRLGPRRYCPDHNTRAEYVAPYPVAGEPGGYVCPFDECGCGFGTLPPNDGALNALDETHVDESEENDP